MDEFSEKFQTAFDPAPTPLSLGKSCWICFYNGYKAFMPEPYICIHASRYEGQIVRNSMKFFQGSRQDEHSKPSGHHSHNNRLYSASSFLNLLFYGTYCGKLPSVRHQQSKIFSAKFDKKKGGWGHRLRTKSWIKHFLRPPLYFYVIKNCIIFFLYCPKKTTWVTILVPGATKRGLFL